MQEFQQEQYFEAIIEKNNFIQILQSIYQPSTLNTNRQQLSKAYDELRIKNNVVKGKDLYQFALKNQQIQSKNSLKIIEQYYNKVIKLQKDGLKCFPKNQFQKIFNPEQISIVDKIISEKIVNNNYVSLEKMKIILNELRNQLQNNQPLMISSNYKIEKSKIQFRNSQCASIAKLYAVAKQYITDVMAIDKIAQLYQQSIAQIQKINQQTQETQQKYQSNLTQLQKLQNEYVDQLNINQEQIDKIEQLIELNKKINEQNRLLQNKKINFLKEISQLKLKNQQLDQQKYFFQNKYEQVFQLNQNTQEFIKNQQNIIKNYQLYIKQIQNKKQSQQSLQNQKIFIKRTNKQRLQDTNMKNARLIQQNKKLQSIIIQMQKIHRQKVQEYQSKIQNLQKNKLDDLKNYKKSQLNVNYSRYRQNCYKNSINIKDIIKSKIQDLNIIQQKVDYNYLKQTSFNKKNNPYYENLNSSIIQPYKFNINQQSQFDFLSLKANIKGTKVISNFSNIFGQQVIFSSSGSIITKSGQSHFINILISPKYLYLLDTKYREKVCHNLQQAVKINFCFYNQNWILFNFKRNKSHQLNDFLFSTFNRDKLILYLSKYCLPILQKKIQFKKQDQLWVKVNKQDYLISKFKGAYNIFNQCFSSLSTFLVNVQQRGLFAIQSLAYQSILVILPLGMLFFYKDKSIDLIGKQKLLYMLPFVQQMKIDDYVQNGEYKIKIFYENQEKSFKIRIDSQSISKKIMDSIKKNKDKNLQEKSNRFLKGKKIFHLA